MGYEKDKIHKINFSVFKCLWNKTKYIITCEVYIYKYQWHSCNYELHINSLDIYEQICLLLKVSEDEYLRRAKEFNAEVQYNKYIQKNECLFITKKDARRFIKEYLQTMLMLVYISGDIIDIHYIYNYK